MKGPVVLSILSAGSDVPAHSNQAHTPQPSSERHRYRSHFGKVRKVPRHDECEIIGRTRKHRYLLPLTPEMKMLVEKLCKPYPRRAASIDSDASVRQMG